MEFDGLRLVAGEAVLDFLNSVKFRGQSDPGERLSSFGDLCRWCLVSGILSEEELERVVAKRSKGILEEALALREAFREFVDDPQDERRCCILASLLRRSCPQLQLLPDEPRVTYAVEINTPGDLVRRLGHEIATFLESWRPERTRSCHAEDCDWVFVDRTKAGGRRWCDSRTCGNRERVRRHRLEQTREAG